MSQGTKNTLYAELFVLVGLYVLVATVTQLAGTAVTDLYHWVTKPRVEDSTGKTEVQVTQ